MLNEAELLPKQHLYIIDEPVTAFHNPVNFAFKRTFDIVVASTLLLLTAPLMVAIMVAVKLTSKGPIFYLQERVTQYERPFYIFKFRTMVENAEDETGPVWVSKNDTRITPFGQFLRRSYLDEIPQLFNILNGDMSVIGPRPERPFFVNQFKEKVPQYTKRHLVKAGLTGYAQLQNPSPELKDIFQKTSHDLWYIQNWSLKTDMDLLMETFARVFKRIFKLSTPS